MRFLVLAVIIAAILVILSKAGVTKPNISPVLNIGGTQLNIEIADTDTKRVQGLSERDSLKEGSGLLFVFEQEGYYGIWMKNMNFPIDIVWLDKNKRIVHIESNVSPQTYPKVFYPPSLSFYVLETNANFLENSKIKIGDVAQF